MSARSRSTSHRIAIAKKGRLILARTLLQKYAKLQKRAINGFADDAVQAIEAYSWPGNVRELENKIKGAVIMADNKMVTAMDLGLQGGDEEGESLNLREVRQVAESKAIRVALTKSYGNISKASELLGITRPTLYDLLNKYGLSADSYSKKAAPNQHQQLIGTSYPISGSEVVGPNRLFIPE